MLDRPGFADWRQFVGFCVRVSHFDERGDYRVADTVRVVLVFLVEADGFIQLRSEDFFASWRTVWDVSLWWHKEKGLTNASQPSRTNGRDDRILAHGVGASG
jgi:hypothetical protein